MMRCKVNTKKAFEDVLFFSLYKLRKIAQYVNNYKLIYI